MEIVLGLLLPFFGTTLGASMVFLMKNNLSSKVEKFLNGFASGVMIAASMFSLLLPAIEMSKTQNVLAWIPTSVGFLIGVVLLFLMDIFLKKLINNKNKTLNNEQRIENKSEKNIKLFNKNNVQPKKSLSKKNTMMMIAVTLHNIPEGMAVGVAFAGVLMNSTLVTIAGALSLAIGIAVQNFPEGAIISMPLKSGGMSKSKSFFLGTLSGIVEPIASIITILLTSVISTILPYLLSFAAGAMIFVVVTDLIPESQSGENAYFGTIGASIGFVLMMVLDIALG